jgi:hypothetical protein
MTNLSIGSFNLQDGLSGAFTLLSQSDGLADMTGGGLQGLCRLASRDPGFQRNEGDRDIVAGDLKGWAGVLAFHAGGLLEDVDSALNQFAVFSGRRFTIKFPYTYPRRVMAPVVIMLSTCHAGRDLCTLTATASSSGDATSRSRAFRRETSLLQSSMSGGTLTRDDETRERRRKSF